MWVCFLRGRRLLPPFVIAYAIAMICLGLLLDTAKHSMYLRAQLRAQLRESG